MKIAGLYLWIVRVSNARQNLLITTATQSAERATRKAMRFLERHRRQYPLGSVLEVKLDGTIDA